MSGNGGAVRVADRLGDPARLRALRSTGLLDDAMVPALDRLTALAARLVGVPVALVSLVDADRQVFASGWGLTGDLAAQRQTPLSHSYCRYVVADDGPLVVPDARADERLRDNPAITDYDAIAYAGFPLHAPTGQVVGSFCVVDSTPRQWTAAQLDILRDLAAAAESEIALRAAHAEVLLSANRMQAVLDSTQDAFVSMTAAGQVTGWNAAAERLLGWSAAEALGRPATELMIPDRFHAAHEAGLARVRRTGVSTLAGQRLELAAVNRAGREFPIEMTLQITVEHGQPVFHAFLHDITERKNAQAQVERERQRLADERTFLQALLDSLDAGVVACDSTGRLALFNQALRVVHGLAEPPATVEAWAGTGALYAADGRTPLRAGATPLARAFAGDLVHGRQLVVRSADGQVRRFLANGRPIDTADGRRLGAVVAMHDITEAHRAEQLRRAQHAVAQALSEATTAEQAAAGAVAAVAAELGWACGEYWEVGDDRRQIIRRSSWTAPGRDLGGFTGPQPLAFGRGEGLPGAVWERGSEIWTADVAAEVADFPRRRAAERAHLRTAIGLPVRSGDRVLGVLAFLNDGPVPRDGDILAMLDGVCAHVGRFIERRRAEELALALAAARRDFARVVEQVNDFVWTVEVLPGGAVRSVLASPNGSAVFGADLPADADLAAVFADRVHADDRRALQRFHAAVTAGRPANIECRVVGFDGVTRWVWTRAVTRRVDGRLFVDGICTDVTARRELAERRDRLLEQEQQQVRRLRELDRMKDELVAVVSHELRNPIGVIRGYAELLLDEPELTDGQRRDLAVIDRTSGHLQRLAEDLLELARLDAGHVSIDPRPLPAGRLVREAVQAHRPAADAHGLTLTADVGRLRPVHGDAGRLRQVLDNLLSNAVKYTPAGGTVQVTARDTADGVVVTVTDSGIGVPAEQYPRLFTRFFRASTAIDHGIKGTGLGLAVTRAIVEAHRGTITAEPAPGGGTRFTVTLPAGAAHPAA